MGDPETAWSETKKLMTAVDVVHDATCRWARGGAWRYLSPAMREYLTAELAQYHDRLGELLILLDGNGQDSAYTAH